MERTSSRRAILAVTAPLALLGCTPYAYSDGVNKFAAGAAAVSNGVSDGTAGIQAAKDDYQATIFAHDRRGVVLNPSECDPGKGPPPCSIALSRAANATPAEGDALAAQAAEARLNSFTAVTTISASNLKQIHDNSQVFDAMKAYSAALIGVVNAADQTALNSAATDFASASQDAVSSLTTLAGGTAANGSANGAIASAAAGVGTDIIGLYLEHRRYLVLKHGVDLVDGQLSTLAKPIKQALIALKSTRRAILVGRAQDLENQLHPSVTAKLSWTDYTALYAALQATLNQINALDAVDTDKLVDAMVGAHNDLRKAIDEHKGQFSAFIKSAQDFYTKANALHKALSS